LIIGGFGYLIINFADLLLPNYANYEEIFLLVLGVPSFLGEFLLAFWLLFRGAKIPEMKS
jgi:hypothetical protein